MAINVTMTNKSGVTLATSGKYCESNVVVAPSSTDQNNLVPANIKKGVSILGVTGTNAPLFEAPIPKLCAYVVTARVVANANNLFTFNLKGSYNNWVNQAANNMMLGYACGQGTLMGYHLNVSISSDYGAATSGSYGRCIMAGSTSAKPQLSVDSYHNYLGAIQFRLNTEAVNMCIFVVDKNLVTANPSEYPKKLNFTDLFEIPSGITVTNI
jgi:hypothetical protein